MFAHKITSSLWLALLIFSAVALLVPPAQAYYMIKPFGTGSNIGGNFASCNDPGGFAHWDVDAYRNIVWSLNTSGQGSNKAAAMQAAMATWTLVSGAKHELVYGGSTTRGWAVDGHNTVLFDDLSVCSSANNCKALTMMMIDTGNVIVESDIIFSTEPGVVWSIDGTGLDTQSALTHELGHSLGIHHSTSSGHPTMESNITDHGTAGRTLTSDDVAALRCSQNRYGLSDVTVRVSGISALDPYESGTWYCLASGGKPPYQRQWYRRSNGITTLGTGYSQSTQNGTSFIMECDVVDSAGQFATDAHSVTVGGGGGGGGGPF